MKKKIISYLAITFLATLTLSVRAQEVYVGDETNGPVTSEDVKIPEPQVSDFLTKKNTSSVQNPLIYSADTFRVKKGDTFVVQVGVGVQSLLVFPDKLTGLNYINNNDAFVLSYNQSKTPASEKVANQLFITAKYPNQQISVTVGTENKTYNFIAVSYAVNSNLKPNLVVYVEDDKSTINFNNQLSVQNPIGINQDTTSAKMANLLTEKLNPIGADLQQYLVNVESLSADDLELARKLGIYNDNYLIVGGDEEFRKNVAVFDNNQFTYLRFTDDPYRVNFGSRVNAIMIERPDYSFPATDAQVIRNYIQIKQVSDIIKIVLDSNLPDNKPPRVICLIRNKDNRYKLIKPYTDN